MRVYCCGSSGTGKTTLCEHISNRYGFKKLPSAAREVFAGFGYASFEALMARPEAYEEFQTRVMRRQIEMEEEFGENFVADRCVDHFAFTALYATGLSRMYRTTSAVAYLDRLKKRSLDGSSLVFFVEPSRVVNAAARADPQGRAEYLDYDAVNQFAGAVKFILQSNGVRYFWINTDSRPERESFVDAQIDAAIGMPGTV